VTFTAKLKKPEDNEDDEDNVEASIQKQKDYVKVALLDDGVDPSWENVGEFLSGSGWPWPSECTGDGGAQTPFYSSGPQQHGNRMAQLITHVCPFVDLYVAKIDSTVDDKLTHPSFDIKQAIDVS
jgi:hypothetical protein